MSRMASPVFQSLPPILIFVPILVLVLVLVLAIEPSAGFQKSTEVPGKSCGKRASYAKRDDRSRV